MNPADWIWAGAAGTQGAGPTGRGGCLSAATEAVGAAVPGETLEERPERASSLKAPSWSSCRGAGPPPGQGSGAREKLCLHHSPWKQIPVTEPDGAGNWDTVRKRGLWGLRGSGCPRNSWALPIREDEAKQRARWLFRGGCPGPQQVAQLGRDARLGRAAWLPGGGVTQGAGSVGGQVHVPVLGTGEQVMSG